MAQDMTLLWGSGSPPCWRVMIALEEKNLQGYNRTQVSFDTMNDKTKGVHPREKLPALKIGDFILNESLGACLYLEDQFKSQGNNLTPDCSAEKAVMYQRVLESRALMLKIDDFFNYNRKVPEGERHDSAVERNKEALKAEIKLWEGYLETTEGGFLAGKTFSLADVAVYPVIAFLHAYGLCAKRYPNLTVYYNSLKERPSIEATWPPTWKKNAHQRDALKDV